MSGGQSAHYRALAERCEALQDLQYVAGAKAGWNLGVMEDNEGFARLVEARQRDALRLLAAKEPT